MVGETHIRQVLGSTRWNQYLQQKPQPIRYQTLICGRRQHNQVYFLIGKSIEHSETALKNSRETHEELKRKTLNYLLEIWIY